MNHAMLDTRGQGCGQSARPILHIITGLGFGGAERLLFNIASESVAAGQSILVVSLLPGGDFRPLFEAAGIEVVDLGMRRRRPSLSGLLRFVSILRARNPMLVQAWLYHANLLALAGLLLSGRRRQTTLLWGVYCTELPVSHYHWTLAPVRWLNARLSRLTDGVIYNARRSQDYHRAIGFREPRSLLLANSVNIERFKPSCELRREVRREMNIPQDAVVVIAVARVDPMKDWPNLMTAVRPLRNVITLEPVASSVMVVSKPNSANLALVMPTIFLMNVFSSSPSNSTSPFCAGIESRCRTSSVGFTTQKRKAEVVSNSFISTVSTRNDNGMLRTQTTANRTGLNTNE